MTDERQALERLYAAVIRFGGTIRIVDPHPEALEDIELQQAMLQAERALGLA